MAANKDFQSNANHRNTESDSDLLGGTVNIVPSDSNAGSPASDHSAENDRRTQRDSIAEARALPPSSTKCNSNGPECNLSIPEDKCSTETSDKIAIAATECPKATTPQHRTSDTSTYRPRPVIDITIYKAFPAASRQRELHQEAMKFAANARNIFVHYIEPILDLRRKEKLSSGTTKKKFYYNAARLWAEMQTIYELHEQRFFWNQKSVEMKLALKKNAIKLGDLLQNAGFEEDWWECRRYAEMAVGWYLGEDLPREFVNGTGDEATTVETADDRDNCRELESLHLKEKLHDVPGDIFKLAFHHDPPEVAKPAPEVDHQLLDVLPEPFAYDSKTMYGQFAHADYSEIRQLDGKQQAARLRQLADLFDATGKVLFYYYAYPHI
ncbi:hypothetical protein HII31_10521 [Pseudocercospora fuligena]|uniref:Uncharacterized protein n=1 Tax=Pseudocercospora fuligena TaxID=685502 RepID=A0A8H6R920_9PEZI|nr:hypothetical protein HII31_10521 [Pseudocercospora fuligena]